MSLDEYSYPTAEEFRKAIAEWQILHPDAPVQVYEHYEGISEGCWYWVIECMKTKVEIIVAIYETSIALVVDKCTFPDISLRKWSIQEVLDPLLGGGLSRESGGYYFRYTLNLEGELLKSSVDTTRRGFCAAIGMMWKNIIRADFPHSEVISC